MNQITIGNGWEAAYFVCLKCTKVGVAMEMYRKGDRECVPNNLASKFSLFHAFHPKFRDWSLGNSFSLNFTWRTGANTWDQFGE